MYPFASLGLLFLVASSPLAAPRSADPAVVINEIHYAPSPATLEFVELYNRGPAPVDLATLTLADRRDVPVALAPRPTTLAPGGYAVAVQDPAAFEAAFGPLPPGTLVLTPTPWPTLNNSGDVVHLAGPNGTWETLTYDGDDAPRGRSLERRHPEVPTLAPSNFVPSTAPLGATPGAINSQYAPDTEPPALLNTWQDGAERVCVRFDEALPPATVPPAESWRVGSHVARHRTVDEATVCLEVNGLPRGMALQLPALQDWLGQVRPPSTAPIAWWPQTGEVVLNELLFAPRTDAFDGHPDQVEYIEIHNTAPLALSLRGLVLAGPVRDDGRTDSLHLTPDPLFDVLEAGSYALLMAAASRADALSTLTGAYPQIPSESVPVLRTTQATLGLRNDGDTVRLFSAQGLRLDGVVYEAAWHHPALHDPRGVALERRRSDRPTQDPQNWSSALHPTGGTPGLINSLPIQTAGSTPVSSLRVHPSPFSPDGDGLDETTEIRYHLALSTALVRVRLYDRWGRLVRTLTPTHLTGPVGRVWWDGFDEAGRRLPLGIYVVLLDAEDAATGQRQVLRGTVVVAEPL
ncbi:MAG: lamin tail domain-containing protein [Bacteroidota bacterium]